MGSGNKSVTDAGLRPGLQEEKSEFAQQNPGAVKLRDMSFLYSLGE